MYDHITYMEDCATRLKDLGHTAEVPKFFRVSSLTQLDEVLANLTTMGQTVLIVHDNTEGSIGDRNISNNYLDSPYYLFYIMKHVALDDFDAKANAKKECKAIAIKIISKMLVDKSRSRSGLLFLDFTNIPYQGIGPVGDNYYGIMVSFTVADNAELIYNADDWD
jgi:hypothetical protein